jgi:hypothetical protein
MKTSLRSRILSLYAWLLTITLAVASPETTPTIVTDSDRPIESAEKLSKDKCNATYTTEKLLLALNELEKDHIGQARLLLNSATLYISRISANEPQLCILNKQLAAAEELYQKASSESLCEKEQTRLKNQQKNAFRKIISSQSGLLHMLRVGKENKEGVSPYRLDYLAKHQTELHDLADNFAEQFSLLLNQCPEFESSHLSVVEVYDLLSYQSLYFNQLVDQTSHRILDELQTELRSVLDTLDSTGRIDASWLNRLYGPESHAPFPQIMQIQSWYDLTGTQLPDEQLEHIQTFKPLLKAAAEAIDKSWDATEPFAVKFNVLGLLQSEGTTLGLNIIDTCINDSQAWTVKKTKQGFPLHKTACGYALFKRDEEPFLRQYEFEATRIFNGVGYEAISTVKLHSGVTIINSRTNY